MVKRTIAIAGICFGLLLTDVMAVQARPLKTWAQVVKEGGPGGRSWRVAVDFDLPTQFRNGFVYYSTGASAAGVYIVRQGLSSYPTPQKGQSELSHEDAQRYMKSGKAIFFGWNLGHSGLGAAEDPKLYISGDTTCFRGTCLTAPYFSQPQINRVLRSRRVLR
ncbi:MAG: hypothetical protein MUC48_13790 [Leptolyngbya sp. Prado105]|jgi:hypothetical protein|nr:hypothetical protein [Leptolyngbya sp. Prado105]